MPSAISLLRFPRLPRPTLHPLPTPPHQPYIQRDPHRSQEQSDQTKYFHSHTLAGINYEIKTSADLKSLRQVEDSLRSQIMVAKAAGKDFAQLKTQLDSVSTAIKGVPPRQRIGFEMADMVQGLPIIGNFASALNGLGVPITSPFAAGPLPASYDFSALPDPRFPLTPEDKDILSDARFAILLVETRDVLLEGNTFNDPQPFMRGNVGSVAGQ